MHPLVGAQVYAGRTGGNIGQNVRLGTTGPAKVRDGDFSFNWKYGTWRPEARGKNVVLPLRTEFRGGADSNPGSVTTTIWPRFRDRF
jgi:hypothetical protein